MHASLIVFELSQAAFSAAMSSITQRVRPVMQFGRAPLVGAQLISPLLRRRSQVVQLSVQRRHHEAGCASCSCALPMPGSASRTAASKPTRHGMRDTLMTVLHPVRRGALRTEFWHWARRRPARAGSRLRAGPFAATQFAHTSLRTARQNKPRIRNSVCALPDSGRPSCKRQPYSPRSAALTRSGADYERRE